MAPGGVSVLMHQHQPCLPAQTCLQELSNTLWALAQLRARPDSMWIARMDRESEDRLHDYTPQNLSNTLHAFATFRWAWLIWSGLPSKLPRNTAEALACNVMDVCLGVAHFCYCARIACTRKLHPDTAITPCTHPVLSPV
jgi:hypothetical protein